ncbi:aminotransferase class V-fold PLP-dependent enzyme, partial [Streptomyces scabiei]
VIIRDDLIEKIPQGLHPVLDYRVIAENGSMYNTPPCWSIYMCGLVYKHYIKDGGLEGAQARSEKKSSIIYDAIDSSGGFYCGHAQ